MIYTRRRCGATNKHAGSEHPEDSAKDEIILVRESVGNGSQNPLLIKAADLVRGWITPDYEDQMQEREGYGGHG